MQLSVDLVHICLVQILARLEIQLFKQIRHEAVQNGNERIPPERLCNSQQQRTTVVFSRPFMATRISRMNLE